MQTKNFKGQDLRGRSFKNQDLTGADFSDCDLRGVDFSFANLTDAKFCDARMGRTLKMSFFTFLLQLITGFFAGVIAIVGSILLIAFVAKYFDHLKIESIALLTVIITPAYTFILSCIILLSINNKNRYYIFYFLCVFVTIGLIVAMLVGEPYDSGGALVTVIFATISSIITCLMIVTILAIVDKAAITIIISIVFGAIFSSILMRNPLEKELMDPLFFFLSLSFNAIILITLGLYLNYLAINKEKEYVLFLRKLSLKTKCFGGTKFYLSILQNSDFEEADLKNSRFKNAKIINCNFQQAKNHHLALTENTPIESRKIRDLVIDGIITDKNFSTLDLRGLDFSNLNLQGFDFSHANLSGANLSHTQMTGAILEGWSIDTETRLDDIECSYYYYLENGEKKRMPPEDEDGYKEGEFTRIFQKIANTIDFIAHNEMELAAIKYSVQQVQAETGNNEIRVQGIEEKDGVIVVKVAVPKFEDRGILYHELKQKITQVQLRLRDKTHRIKELKSEIDDLKNKIQEKRQNLTVIIENSNINNDGIMLIASDTNGNISQQTKL